MSAIQTRTMFGDGAVKIGSDPRRQAKSNILKEIGLRFFKGHPKQTRAIPFVNLLKGF